MALHTQPPRTASARRTLVGLLLIPLLSLTGLWAFTASITLGNVIQNQHYNTLVNTIGPSVVGLEQTLEPERGLTIAWLSADRRSPQLRTQLLAARRAADTEAAAMRVAAAAVRGLLSTTGQAQLSTFLTKLNGLAGIRAAVDTGADDPVAAFTAYSAISSAEYGFFHNATPPADSALSLMTQAGIAESRAEDFTNGVISLAESAFTADGRMTAAERLLFAQVMAGQNMEIDDTFALANDALAVLFRQLFDSPAYRQLQVMEGQISSSPAGPPLPVRPAAFQATAQAVQAAMSRFGQPRIGEVLAARSAELRDSLRTELYLAGGLGLAAVLVSVFVAVRFGRRIRGELSSLYDSARQMADERLPRLVERLRRGEDVDVSVESPPLRPGRVTEIADVAQAFSSVQRTAVEAAVGQADLRKGVNQVFVSLSLRNQSLLHRQLGMLDDMERATSDPVALADLFRLDHLTTRMRRHAEGLLILAGSTPGRGWRDPVPVADVLNAAVAEVEDYVRVDVVTDSADAVAGTAINDVIHLLAELVENATTFSPPNTRVEIRGDSVGHGFAVEIEDRGLGMPAEEIAAINARLANPPDFDLANGDQLGLFVAARLAERHRIRVSLRQSPVGGTTAIVLLPVTIIVPGDGESWTPGTADAGDAPAATVFGLTGRYRRLGPAPEAGLVPGSRPAPPALDRPALDPPALDLAAFDMPALDSTAAADGWFSRDKAAGGPGANGTAPGGARFAGAAPHGSRPGLPRRARGTNLAPQLRAKLGSAGREGPRAPAWPGAAGTSPGEEPPARSPEEASSLLSALQDGWKRARIEDLDYFDGEDHP